MTTVTGTETYSLRQFNQFLDQQINFLNENGKVLKMQFWAALHAAPQSAQKLLDRLNARVEHYRVATDRKGIAAELKQFQEQRDHFVTLVATARSVVEKFAEMKRALNKSSKLFVSKPIMAEEDIAPVSAKITDLTNAFESKYLTGKWLEGTGHVWNSTPTITGRIARLEELQNQEKV
ncbi:MAG: hypothetical protein KR126chlam3_01430 [Chlamydiae bacterium]|nr:hypothetical protein [Chlamydiota bacterium]